AAGDFGAGREVEAAEALADVDMVENLKVEAPRLAPAPLLAVLLGAFADRHRFVRQVGNAAEEILEAGLELGELLFGALEELLQLLALRQQLAHVLAARLRLADVLRDLVARGLRLLDRGLQVLARLLEAPERVDVERPWPARGEAARDRLRILAQQLDVDHFSLPACASRCRNSARRSRSLASSPRSVGRYHSIGGMPSGK